MSNKFQIKRTSVSGRTPNTTSSSNSAFIDAGELAINLTDGKVFSSNGTISFEVGANLTSLAVSTTIVAANITSTTANMAVVNVPTDLTLSGTLTANGSSGANGQVLVSSASGVYWATLDAGGGVAADYFPIGDYGIYEHYVGDDATATDAFGIHLLETFDCLTEPAGKLAQQDFGVLT